MSAVPHHETTVGRWVQALDRLVDLDLTQGPLRQPSTTVRARNTTSSVGRTLRLHRVLAGNSNLPVMTSRLARHLHNFGPNLRQTVDIRHRPEGAIPMSRLTETATTMTATVSAPRRTIQESATATQVIEEIHMIGLAVEGMIEAVRGMRSVVEVMTPAEVCSMVDGKKIIDGRGPEARTTEGTGIEIGRGRGTETEIGIGRGIETFTGAE